MTKKIEGRFFWDNSLEGDMKASTFTENGKPNLYSETSWALLLKLKIKKFGLGPFNFIAHVYLK